MQLSFQHQEVVQDLMLEHDLLIVSELNDRHLEVELDAFKRSSTN